MSWSASSDQNNTEGSIASLLQFFVDVSTLEEASNEWENTGSGRVFRESSPIEADGVGQMPLDTIKRMLEETVQRRSTV